MRYVNIQFCQPPQTINLEHGLDHSTNSSTKGTISSPVSTSRR